MRKRISFKKLKRTANERKQLLRNMISSLVIKGAIDTSITKAKFLQPNIEKLVTKAKKDSLNSLRHLIDETGNLSIAKRLIKYGKLFAVRPGGYTRIIHLGFQEGDNTEKVRIEMVEKLVEAEVVVKPKVKKTTIDNKIEKTSKTTKTNEPKLLKKTIKTKK